MGSAKITRNESTERARQVWAAVDRAAEKAPEKVKKRISRALKEGTNG